MGKLFNIASNSLFLIFLTVNIFNLIPLQLRNPQWQSDIFTLILDTTPILLIAIIIKFVGLKNPFSFSPEINTQPDQKLLNFKKIGKLNFYFSFFYFFISGIQVFMTFGNLNMIDFNTNLRLDQLQTNFERAQLEINKKSKLTEKNLLEQENFYNEFSNNDKFQLGIKEINKEKDKALKNIKLEKINKEENIASEMNFLIFVEVRDRIRSLVLSLIWAFTFLKISKLKLINIDGIK